METIPSREELMSVLVRVAGNDTLGDAVVYVCQIILQPGHPYQFARHSIKVSKPSVLLFIDLKPEANWGHECLYLTYDGKDVNKIRANFPPDSENLLILSKPNSIENWALLTDKYY